ncbi:hypothetical protein COCNU_06G016310 [Cocos nucifera]|uniref:Uncharacterized protein n=1 Tax=Cocos nucifera TaxID=13894 RepID=A0A8K0IDC3_COCNU|nr:hypothetical protein COCNU_06G016310 [Cocos nucifera]
MAAMYRNIREGMRVSLASLHRAIKKKPESGPGGPSRDPSKRLRVGSPPQIEADKGKAPMPPAFTTEYGPDTASREAIITIDWEVRKAYPVLKILSGSYMSLLSMAHNMTILYEGLTGFIQLNSKLKDKAQTTNARAEVIKELLHATEEREKKYQEKLALLEVELGTS